MVKFLTNSRWLHVFTNSFLLGNLISCIGKSNSVVGRLFPLLFRCSVTIKGASNRLVFGKGKHRRLKVFVKGNGNEVIFGDNCITNETTIWIIADNCRVVFGSDNIINNAEFGAEDDGSAILLDDDVQVGGHVQLGMSKNNTIIARMYASEGKSITIRKQSRISDGTVIRTGDSHGIFNSENERINFGKDVYIGSHVWVCAGVVVLKGAYVADNSVVGAMSLVTQSFTQKGGLIAGSPAKLFREGVRWEM